LPEVYHLAVPVDSKVSDVARIISSVVKHRFSSISVKGKILLKDELFTDFFEPEEVQQLDALPGQKPGVIPLEGEWTILHKAAGEGNVKMISEYATRPEFINARTMEGATPLWCAADAGSVEAVEALFELGADIDLPTMGGATPLYFAAQEGHLEAVKALASLGADVNLPMDEGTTRVFITAAKGHDGVALALVSLGADVNVGRTDRKGRSFTSTRLTSTRRKKRLDTADDRYRGMGTLQS
jgi:ankyrin repeat protein